MSKRKKVGKLIRATSGTVFKTPLSGGREEEGGKAVKVKEKRVNIPQYEFINVNSNTRTIQHKSDSCVAHLVPGRTCLGFIFKRKPQIYVFDKAGPLTSVYKHHL